MFHSFLLEEWAKRKHAKIIFYKRLASFFGDHFPTSVLATDLEKELLIKDLKESGSFATTHSVVARLGTYKKFNMAQRNAIVEATLGNNQVYLIATDEDVHAFLKRVLEGHESEIEPETLGRLMRRLEDKPELDVNDAEGGDLPF